MSDFTRHYASYLVPQPPADGTLSVRSFGTTTLLFDDGRTRLLFDGMVTRPSMLTFAARPLRPNEALVSQLIDRFGFRDLAAIFVSHSHYDHVLDVPIFARETGAQVYGSPSTLNVARGNGIQEARLHDFTLAPTNMIGSFTITALPSIHSKPSFYNNDLGVPIDKPLVYPARGRQFTEGGSYDFLIEHGSSRYLIRPSCNDIPGQLAGIRAEVLFLGVGGINKLSSDAFDTFYRETVGQAQPSMVIPVHWDNFFLPLERANHTLPQILGNPYPAIDRLIGRLERDGIAFRVLPTLGEIRLDG